MNTHSFRKVAFEGNLENKFVLLNDRFKAIDIIGEPTIYKFRLGR